jgi:SAM-dependent methyltransferase
MKNGGCVLDISTLLRRVLVAGLGSSQFASLEPMDRQDFVLLMSPEGQQLLGEVDYQSKTDVVKLVSGLRAKGHDPALVAAVLTQAKLRHRAAAKFGEFAQRMLFTEPGLEQASRLNVAALHAGRFRSAQVTTVADLGCGIGAESLSMAAAGIHVTAFEIDEVTAALATYNLLPFDNARVELADVTQLELGKFDALFFDPARRELTGAARAQAVRKFDPSTFSPNFDWVVEQCEAPHVKAAGIKLGPGHPHEGIPDSAEAQWVSVNGDLVELGLWFGAAARPGIKRAALLLETGIDGTTTKHELTSVSTAMTYAPLGELAEYVFEPDNAVVRSHLIHVLAEQTGTHSFSAEIAYLTGNQPLQSPWLKGYRVLENLAFDRKKLKARIRELEIGVLEIKKRGADIVPEQLRKELAPKGKNSATLIVTRVGEAHRVLICQPT